MVRVKPLLAFAILSLSLTGCWSKVEINDRTFITGIFIDMADKSGEVELTILCPLPNRMADVGKSGEVGTGNAIPYAVVSKTGSTFQEAFQNIQSDLTRRLTWGQTKVLVVSMDYIKNGMKDFLEWGARHQTFHFRSFVFVAPGKAKDVTKLTPVFEQSPSEVLREFARQGTLLDTTIKDILQSAYAGQGVAVNMLTYGSHPMVSEGGRNSVWVGTDGAIMLRGSKWAGELDKDEARAISWGYHSLKNPIYTIPLEQGKCSLMLRQLNLDLTPVVKNGAIAFKIKMQATAEMVAALTSMDVSLPKVIHDIEQKLEERVEGDMRRALVKSQQAKTDILRLGMRLEWRYPKVWKRVKPQWSEVYGQQVAFEIDAQITFQHFNSELKPLWQME